MAMPHSQSPYLYLAEAFDPQASRKVAEALGLSNQQTYTFPGLDINIEGGYILNFAIKNTQASTAIISCYMNGDTTATNYWRTVIYTFGGGLYGGTFNDAIITGLTGGQNMIVAGNIRFSFNATFNLLQWTGNYSRSNANPVATDLIHHTGSVIRKIEASAQTNITSITVSSDIAGGISGDLLLYKVGP